jgi:hypothetical protein
MKEFLEGINLPKQLLDKTDKFLSTIFGPAAKEMGELYADKIRYKRLKNQVDILEKSMELMERNNLSPKQLNLKTLVPLIENSSLEDDELLQSKWANLIANIASSPETGLEPKLIKTLSQMSSLEARVLDFVYDYFLQERQQLFDRLIDSKWANYKSVEGIKPDRITIREDSIKKQFKLTEEFTIICIENLIALGIIKYEEPEIQIEDDGSKGNLENEDSKGEREVTLDFDLTANYSQSNDFKLTVYGKYFVENCKINTIEKTIKT